MKKLIILILALSVISCKKTRTCTCKMSSGTVYSKRSITSNSKQDIRDFESKCKASHSNETQNGVLVAQVPCELG